MFENRVRTELVSELFVRGLGLVYAIAFVSLGVQIIGLVGARGIDPAAEFLARAATQLGDGSALEVPTWLWLTGASDSALRALSVAGVVCALLVAAAWLPRLALLAAWSLYLSLCSVGGAFLSFQWDTLLLECGLVGLFVATPRSSVGLWVARALCLKLMFLSGLVKLTSGDSTWRDLSALSYHFWTQPLPAWPAVLANALPAWMKAAMTFACLTTELVAPLLIVAPRTLRLGAAAALAFLQLVIAATGSYGFFNLLSLLLCAALLDDDALLAITPPRIRAVLERHREQRASRSERIGEPAFARARSALHVGLAAFMLVLSASVVVDRFGRLPSALDELLLELAPLRSVNRYGLFAVMTTERREIAIEGSLDGVTWRPYEFKWKPDRLDERPRFVAPHMPRLDWQMWFAALSGCERQRWFHGLLKRVLEGAPDVLDLFERNPFPKSPPRFVRTPRAKYRFAPASEWRHGKWWVSEPDGEYCPEVTLREGLVRPSAHSGR
jgi:hypothetical protein